MLLVALGIVRIVFAHHDHDAAARIGRARGPPFTPVDDVFIAVALDPGFDVGGVGRRNLNLRHRESRADFAGQQRLQPRLLLCLGAIAHQHFHVAGIGRRAVERFRPEGGAPHLFTSGRVFQVGEPGTQRAVGQKEVPKPRFLGFRLQLLDQRGRLPAVAHLDLGQHLFFARIDMRDHEGVDRIADFAGLRAVGKIHSSAPKSSRAEPAERGFYYKAFGPGMRGVFNSIRFGR